MHIHTHIYYVHTYIMYILYTYTMYTHIYTVSEDRNIAKYEEIKHIFFAGKKFGDEMFQCTDTHKNTKLTG